MDTDKTKLIVKDDQILVDIEIIFQQIEEAGGDWQKVRQMYEELKKAMKQNGSSQN